jgi:hypothetical protein
MANRYGEAALMAARKMSSTDIDPLTRWESAMTTLYPTSPLRVRREVRVEHFWDSAKRD